MFRIKPPSAVSRHSTVEDNLHTGTPGVKLTAYSDSYSLWIYIHTNIIFVVNKNEFYLNSMTDAMLIN